MSDNFTEKQKPQAGGFYWYRPDNKAEWEIVDVDIKDRLIFYTATDVPLSLDDSNGEWVGPIQPPT